MAQDPDLERASMKERKAFVRVLSSLAWADGVVDDRRKLANHQIEVGDTCGAGLLGMAQRDLQDAFGNGQFMHIQDLSLGNTFAYRD